MGRWDVAPREQLHPGLTLPDKGRLFPAPRLRFDFTLHVTEEGAYRVRGTLLDLGREELLGHEGPADGLVSRQEPESSDTLESFWVEAPTIAGCIDGIVRKVAQGRICSRYAQFVTTGPAGIREELTRRWLAAEE
jgi:hypothetical protein